MGNGGAAGRRSPCDAQEACGLARPSSRAVKVTKMTYTFLWLGHIFPLWGSFCRIKLTSR